MYQNGSQADIQADRPLHVPQWFSSIRQTDRPLRQWLSGSQTDQRYNGFVTDRREDRQTLNRVGT